MIENLLRFRQSGLECSREKWREEEDFTIRNYLQMPWTQGCADTVFPSGLLLGLLLLFPWEIWGTVGEQSSFTKQFKILWLFTETCHRVDALWALWVISHANDKSRRSSLLIPASWRRLQTCFVRWLFTWKHIMPNTGDLLPFNK